MPPGKSSAGEAELVIAPLSTVFCADDADMVIRAAGILDFCAHKVMLSFVSPFFKTMFTVPQPPTDTPGALPHVDVDESAETWENILRTIYPMPNPVIDNLNDLVSLLLAATKYEMQFVIDSHKLNLENRQFIQQEPLRLYAVACACGLDDQAKFVARNAELLTVTRGSRGDDLNGATIASYCRLITFLVERDNGLHPILEQGWMSFDHRCACLRMSKGFYKKTREKLKTPYIQMEEAYSSALEERSHYHQNTYDGSKCVVKTSEIRGFFGRMFKERERICNDFIW